MAVYEVSGDNMRTKAIEVSVTMLNSLLIELDAEPSKDLTKEQLALRCIELLMIRTVKAYGKNITDIDAKEFYICELFVFILSEYIARILNLDVEELTVVAYVTIFAKHQNSTRLMDMYRDSENSYNDFRRRHPKSMDVARTVFTGCIVGPDRVKSLFTVPRVFKSLIDCLA